MVADCDEMTAHSMSDVRMAASNLRVLRRSVGIPWCVARVNLSQNKFRVATHNIEFGDKSRFLVYFLDSSQKLLFTYFNVVIVSA